MLLGILCYSIHVCHSFLLLKCVDSVYHLSSCIFSYCSINILACLEYLVGLLFLAYLSNDVLDESADVLDLLVTEQNSLEHLILRNLISACFYHHDGFFSTAYCEVDVRYLSLFECRVDNELAVYHSYYYACSRAIPWNVRDSDCCGCTEQCCDLRLAVNID